MKQTLLQEVSWLIGQGRPFAWLHAGNLVMIVISGLMTLVDPLIMKWLIDDVLPRRQPRLLPLVAGAFLASYTLRLASNRAGSLLMFLAVQRMAFRMRLSLLRRLQRLPARYHENTPTGETMIRLEQDVEMVAGLGTDFIPHLLRLVIVTSMILVVMSAMNWRLTLLIVPLVPAFLLLRHRFRSRQRRHSDFVRQQQGILSSFLQEQVASMTQVQLLTRESYLARRFVALAGNWIRAQSQLRRTSQSFSMLSLSVVSVGVAAILGYGGYEVMTGALSAGGLVAFYSYLVRLFEPMNNAVSMSSRLQRVGASIRSIMQVTEQVPLDGISGTKKLRTSGAASVELRDVCFGYRPGLRILDRTSFHVTPGERVALVGASGSGKSTVAKLLTGLYEPQSGSVLVDSQDVREIDKRSLRAAIALVTQETVLFDATLRENILLGNPKATRAKLDHAVEVAQLGDLLRHLPGGLNESIGPRGCQLSGGERHRVSLARAVLREPRVLILDEPTAALDAMTERECMEALSDYVRGRTTLVISHRLSTILWAERIVVINDGQVTETGTHEQLYRPGSHYRRLCAEEFDIDDSEVSKAPPAPLNELRKASFSIGEGGLYKWPNTLKTLQ